MRKKITWITATVLGLILAVVAVFWFFPVLKVSRVDVQGVGHLEVAEVRAAADIDPNANFLRLHDATIAEKVSNLAWVDSVNVKKQLPTTVKITITEHQAVGFIETNDGFAIFDEEGRVFLHSEQPQGGLLVQDLPDDGEQAAQARQAAATVISALTPQQQEQVQAIRAPKADQITLVLPEDRTVYWGSTDNTAEKVEALRYAFTRPEQKIDISGAPLLTIR